MSNKNLETTFQILAAILMGVAAIFLWFGNYEGLFVASVLSSASYFLSFRYQVKERLDVRDAERIERELDEMNANNNMLKENKSLFDVEKAEFNKEKEIILEEK